MPRRNQARSEREGTTERRSSRRTENATAGISSCGNRRQVLTPFERVEAHRRRMRYRFKLPLFAATEAGADINFLVRPQRARELAQSGLVIVSPAGNAMLRDVRKRQLQA
jgi:hypothetical protein